MIGEVDYEDQPEDPTGHGYLFRSQLEEAQSCFQDHKFLRGGAKVIFGGVIPLVVFVTHDVHWGVVGAIAAVGGSLAYASEYSFNQYKSLIQPLRSQLGAEENLEEI